jgi:DNA polymerase-3 subunit epsilon
MSMLRRKLRRIWRSVKPLRLEDNCELVAFDLETSNLDPRTASILSIGAVPVRERRVMLSECFTRTIRSTAPVDHEAVKFHRMRPMDVAEGEAVEDAVADFLAWLSGRPLIAYCVGFDGAMLDRVLHETGQGSLDNVQLDIRDLYRQAVSRRNPDNAPALALDAILSTLDVPVSGRHTALGDATAVAIAYLTLKFGTTWHSARAA